MTDEQGSAFSRVVKANFYDESGLEPISDSTLISEFPQDNHKFCVLLRLKDAAGNVAGYQVQYVDVTEIKNGTDPFGSSFNTNVDYMHPGSINIYTLLEDGNPAIRNDEDGHPYYVYCDESGNEYTVDVRMYMPNHESSDYQTVIGFPDTFIDKGYVFKPYPEGNKTDQNGQHRDPY